MLEETGLILHSFRSSTYSGCRFRRVYSQLEYLSDCLPVRICQALAELPDTLDGTYERVLRDIKSTNWEFERRLFLCAAMASRPHSVEELAEFLAFDSKAAPYSKFRADWRLEDPIDVCCLLAPYCLPWSMSANLESHSLLQFSVKEFLTFLLLAENRDSLFPAVTMSLRPSLTLVAQACLGHLLYPGENVTRKTVWRNSPLPNTLGRTD